MLKLCIDHQGHWWWEMQSKKPTSHPCYSKILLLTVHGGRREVGKPAVEASIFKDCSARPPASLTPMRPSPPIIQGALNKQLLCPGHSPTSRPFSKHAIWQEGKFTHTRKSFRAAPLVPSYEEGRLLREERIWKNWDSGCRRWRDISSGRRG